MNIMTDAKNLSTSSKPAAGGKVRMTPSEAFVETLVAHKVKDVFGIVGSAYMDALDLFPRAGIRLHLGRARAERRAHGRRLLAASPAGHGVCIAQNGPGITNFVTASPRPTGRIRRWWRSRRNRAASRQGHGGFQETEQMPIFSKITQVPGAREFAAAHGGTHAPRASPSRMHERGPVQINIPRDYFYGEIGLRNPRAARTSSAARAAPELARRRRRRCSPRRNSR